MELDKHYKVRVNPEQSRKIQELLFALGGCWLSGSHFKEPVMLDADCLFLNKLMVLTCTRERGNCYFENKHTHTEIQADDLIALLTDLSKSAENPLQDMKLTPEFETEASEPKFKVGDKVYLFGADYIEEITKIIGANFYLAGADFDASVSIKEICHATPENYERLQATFTDIEFERPPSQADIDNEAVDKLAQAMKNKLAKKREQGYKGWETCKHGDLVQLLINHVDKGDPIDVANFCAFLFARGEQLTQGGTR